MGSNWIKTGVVGAAAIVAATMFSATPAHADPGGTSIGPSYTARGVERARREQVWKDLKTAGYWKDNLQRRLDNPTDRKIIEKCESLDTPGYVAGGIAGILGFGGPAGVLGAGEGVCHIAKKFHNDDVRGAAYWRKEYDRLYKETLSFECKPF